MAERNTPYKDGELVPHKIAGSTKVEAGKMAAVNASGYGVEGSDTAGLIVQGMYTETVDNSDGSDGDLSAKVSRGKAYKFANSSTNAVTQAHVGSDVYVEDDETVASSTTNSIVAGKCLGIETDGVWVAIG